MALHVGISGWSYPEWRGRFYPRALKPDAWLGYYAGAFATAEINASFYRLPKPEVVRRWRAAVPEGFVFAWKASSFITHNKKLRDAEDSVDLMFERARLLGGKLGPILFQLPPSLKMDRERLAGFFKVLPRRRSYVFEFRHPSWYEAAILDLLRDHDAALCFSDHRDAPAPWEITARHVYVRAHGPGGHYQGHYPDRTLRAFARHMRRWGRRSVYCYFDNTTKSAAPDDAKRLLTLLARRR